MRFYLTGLSRPKKVAQHLSAMFPTNKLSTSQELTAKLYGYRNWHEMAEITKNGGNTPSQLDEYLSEEEQAARSIEQSKSICKVLNLSQTDDKRIALIRQMLTSRVSVALPNKPKSAPYKRK
jgi:hypothetical protein